MNFDIHIATGVALDKHVFEAAIDAGVDEALASDLRDGIDVKCGEDPDECIAAYLRAENVRPSDEIGMELDIEDALYKGLATIGYPDARVSVAVEAPWMPEAPHEVA